MTAGFAGTGPVGPAEDRPGEPERTGPLPPRLDRPGPPPPPPPSPTWPAYGQTGGFPVVPPGPPGPPAPAAPRRRGTGPTVLAAVLVFLVLAQAAYLVYLDRQLAAANKKASATASSDARALDDLRNRVGALERQAAKAMDVPAVSQAVLPSVFRIDVPEGSATAFAVGKPSSGGTDLLTNYHVVAGLWRTGKRDAPIGHDNLRYNVRIVRVDADNDLALLHADEKFPAVVPAPAQVQVGTPVLLIGAPLGLRQSVTSGVVSAVRTDVPGAAGKTFIQFDAAINFGNSGGPVVNAQKQVIGVAAAKANGTEGIGLAVPISVACQSFSGLC